MTKSMYTKAGYMKSFNFQQLQYSDLSQHWVEFKSVMCNCDTPTTGKRVDVHTPRPRSPSTKAKSEYQGNGYLELIVNLGIQ